MDRETLLLQNRSRSRFRYARRCGYIIPPDVCSKCQSKGPVDGHHEDYSQPLEVVWLCRTCHNIENGRRRRVNDIIRHQQGLDKNVTTVDFNLLRDLFTIYYDSKPDQELIDKDSTKLRYSRKLTPLRILVKRRRSPMVSGLQASLQAEADDQGLSLSSYIRSILLQRMRERAKKGS